MTELYSRQLFRNFAELRRSHDEIFFRLAYRVILGYEGDTEIINKFIDRIERDEITHSGAVQEIQKFLAFDAQASTSMAPIQLSIASRNYNQRSIDITRNTESCRLRRMKSSSFSIGFKSLSDSITPLEKIGRFLSRGDK